MQKQTKKKMLKQKQTNEQHPLIKKKSVTKPV